MTLSPFSGKTTPTLMYKKVSSMLFDWQYSLTRSLQLKPADRDRLIKAILKLMESENELQNT